MRQPRVRAEAAVFPRRRVQESRKVFSPPTASAVLRTLRGVVPRARLRSCRRRSRVVPGSGLVPGRAHGTKGKHTSTRGISVALAAAAVCVLLAVPSGAGAARSGVTIHHNGRVDFYGFVFSPDPQRCADRRRVKLFRQRGKVQNQPRDKEIGEIHAIKTDSGKFKWRIHTRQRHGKFYARIDRNRRGWRPDNSRTIHT